MKYLLLLVVLFSCDTNEFDVEKYSNEEYQECVKICDEDNTDDISFEKCDYNCNVIKSGIVSRYDADNTIINVTREVTPDVECRFVRSCDFDKEYTTKGFYICLE